MRGTIEYNRKTHLPLMMGMLRVGNHDKRRSLNIRLASKKLVKYLINLKAPKDWALCSIAESEVMASRREAGASGNFLYYSSIATQAIGGLFRVGRRRCANVQRWQSPRRASSEAPSNFPVATRLRRKPQVIACLLRSMRLTIYRL